MDRCVMFIDAGYVHKMSDLGLGESHNSRVELVPVSVMTTLQALAQELTGIPLLRIYWYDAASGRVPSPSHKELARQGAIKIRIGSLKKRNDGSIVQKGVDAEIHADMVDLARRSAVCDMVLLSGDEDLLRAVEDVQKYGVRVHLWGIDAGGTLNQSAELIMASDIRHILPESWVRAIHGLDEQMMEETAEETPATPSPAPSTSTVTVTPSPATLPPRSRMPAPIYVSSLTREQQEFAPLSELSTITERTRDDSEDSGKQFTDSLAGETYGGRWLERATVAAVHRLRDEYPHIPRSIDAELLRYADRQGVDTWNPNERAKYAVRDGFWKAIRNY